MLREHTPRAKAHFLTEGEKSKPEGLGYLEARLCRDRMRGDEARLCETALGMCAMHLSRMEMSR